MAGITLTSKTINSTYDSLLKLTDNDGLTASFKTITDGLGNDSGISINNAGNVQISGTLNVSGTTTIGSVLRGNATLTIDPAAHGDNTGLVVIAGDLQVDGTTTTINSTTVSLDDKNILLAAEAANKAAANGAGITVETGTNDPVVTDATILYNGTDDTWDFNKVVTASSFTGNLTGDVTGNIKLNDNDQILAGTGDDLSIYHSGSHSFIRQLGTGSLYIDQASDDKNIVFRNDNGSGGLDNYFIINGLYEENIFYKTIDLSTGSFKVGGTTLIDSSRNITATKVGVTNIVTNKIVKFAGTWLDDSSISDDGTTVTIDADLTVDNIDVRGESIASGDLDAVDRGLYYWGSTQPTTGSTGHNYMMALTTTDPNQNIQLAWGGSSHGKLLVRRADSGTYYDWTEFWSDADFSGTQITQWDSAYTYSQVGHLPLAGGTLTGNLTMSADDDRIYFGNRNGAIFFDTTLDAVAMQQTQGTDWTRIHVGDVSTGNYKFKVLGGDSTNSSEFAATGWNDLFTINGDGDTDLVTGNLQIGSTVVITTGRNLTNIGTGSFSGDITFADGKGIVSSAGAKIATGSGGGTFQSTAAASNNYAFIANNSSDVIQLAVDAGGQGWSYFAGDLAVNQTTQPAHKLEVNGTAEIKGSLYLNTEDSLGFEDGKHWITYNDGAGNFNIRVGHYDNSSGIEECTEAGYIFHDEWSQSGGWRQFSVSSASMLEGGLIGTDANWSTQIEYNQDQAILRYQGNTRIATASNGVYVSGGGVRVNGTTNNLWIEETTNNEWHIYDTFQDNGIIIHSSSGGMEFQYNGNTELTINGAGVVFNGTVDISNANLNIGAADIVFDTVSTNANRGLVWDVDGSYLSKLVSGGTNTGMVEIYTNMNDGITGDVFRVKTGSTATTPFSIDNTGDATFTGEVSADTLQLTSGTAPLTFTESALDWSITNVYTGYNNGLTIFNGTGGIALNYAGSEIANFNANGIALNDGVDITGGLEVSANVNVTGDTYTLGEFSQGVTTANKIYAYGSEFRASGASIQIVFGRDTNSIGSGAIGADSTNCFAVWNTDSTVKRMSISQGGSMAIGNITPTHKLTVDGDISCDDIFLTGDVDLGDTGIVKNTNAVFFNNSEMDTAYYPDASGTLAFDENFYSDTTYGTGTYNPAQVWGSDGGGLVVKSEDGWGGVFTSVNSRWATPTWDGLIVNNEIGVGVTSPQAGLHINHSTKPQLLLDGGSDTTGDIVVPDGEILQVGHWNNTTSTYTDRFRIDASGRVGIGTTPTSPLHIDGGATSEVLQIEANADPYIRWVENGVDVGFLQFKGDEAYLSNQSNGTFFFRTNNTNKMVISGGGEVGIGVTSPSYRFHAYHPTTNVVGQFESGDNQAWVSVRDSGYTTYGAMLGCDNANSENIILAGNGAQKRFIIDDSGNAILGSDSPTALTSSAYSLSLGGENATTSGGLFHQVNGVYKGYQYVNTSTGFNWNTIGLGYEWSIDGSNKMMMNTSGDIGINRSSPNAKLHVVGDMQLGTTATTQKGDFHIYNGTGSGEFYVHATDSPYNTSEGVNESPAMRLHLDNGAGSGFEISMDNDCVDRDAGNNGFAFRITTQDGGFGTYGKADTIFNVAPRGHTYIGYGSTRSGLTGDPMLAVNGVIHAANDVVAFGSSDRRLKDNIKPIENAIEKVNAIGGYEFDWNDNQEVYVGHDVGVIAQEIEEVLPEVVETRDNGYKAVKYEKIVPLLIEAIKDQQKQINELKEMLNGSTK